MRLHCPYHHYQRRTRWATANHLYAVQWAYLQLGLLLTGLLFLPCLKHLDIKGHALITALHLGLFLETLPNLEHLKVSRVSNTRETDAHCGRREPDSYDLDEHDYATARPKFHLRILEVEYQYLAWFRNQLLFTRLPHLQELSLLRGERSVWKHNMGSDYQPQTFSLWLNHCCPDLRSIRCEMTAHLDFQGPPAFIMLPGLNRDGTTTNKDTWALFESYPGSAPGCAATCATTAPALRAKICSPT
ncbi:hypothetical protein BG003_004783 [Podila horticola]|nr:hypothetical protein BG003_004783 [Podila horticola]